MREVNVEGRFASLEGSHRRLGLMQPWGFDDVAIGNGVKASFGQALCVPLGRGNQKHYHDQQGVFPEAGEKTALPEWPDAMHHSRRLIRL